MTACRPWCGPLDAAVGSMDALDRNQGFPLTPLSALDVDPLNLSLEHTKTSRANSERMGERIVRQVISLWERNALVLGAVS
jgi:hypothetical protein